MATDTAIARTSPRSVDVSAAPGRRGGWTYRPHVDIFDLPNEIQLIADLPGSDPDTIDVALEAGILTIQSHVAQRPHAAGSSVMLEYGVGNYHRRFEIDESIDGEGVTAEYREGTLTVHLPKAQQARRRRIEVKT